MDRQPERIAEKATASRATELGFATFPIAVLIALSSVLITAGRLSAETLDRSESFAERSNAMSRPSPEIIVSGTTSVLYLPVSKFPIFANKKYVCTDIELRPVGELHNVVINSVGLGPVTFQEKAAPQGCDSSKPIAGTPNVLEFGKLTEEIRVRLQIGPLNLPKPKNALVGKVIVRADGLKPVEIPVRVEHPPSTTFWTAVTSFLGVVIPAALAALSAYWLNFLYQRRNKAKTLSELRGENAAVLDTLFENFYPVLCKKSKDDDAKFVRELKAELKYHGLLEKLPAEEALKLRKKLNNGDRQAVILELVRLFPEWSAGIMKPEL